jgi:hypothetical protein
MAVFVAFEVGRGEVIREIASFILEIVTLSLSKGESSY